MNKHLENYPNIVFDNWSINKRRRENFYEMDPW